MAWTWRYDPAGDGSLAEPERFPNQSDAESWLGESWRELLAAGVERVWLLEDDREVYGPMGLDAA